MLVLGQASLFGLVSATMWLLVGLSMLVSTDPSSDRIVKATWKWLPMLDTLGLRMSSEDTHWPVTVYDRKLVCVRSETSGYVGNRLATSACTGNSCQDQRSRGALTASEYCLEGEEDEEAEQEFLALSAQAVSEYSGRTLLSQWHR